MSSSGAITPLQSLVLGAVQGVTEFLPVSSTAHLRVVPALAGWRDPGAAFTAVLQLGSLVAVLGFFFPDLVRMTRAAVAAAIDPGRRRDPDVVMLAAIAVGTMPVVVFGLLLRHAIEGSFRTLGLIAGALIAVAIALAVVERRARLGRALADLTLRDGALIGLAQALALVPGVSRSGITLLAALGLGFRRDAAARYSFLLSVPAVTAAGIYELPKVIAARDIGALPLALGLAAAAVAGFASIAWLLRFLRSRTTLPFILYRIGLGALLLALTWSGIR